MDVAQKIEWIPEFGLDRELDWLKNMHDWLISKKRYYALALPIWECKKCHQFEVIGGYEELKERAVEGWEDFEGHTPHRPYVDAVKIKCSECGEVVSRVPDVGNPWLDAGIVPFSTIKQDNQGEPLYLTNREEWQKWFPVDFITESFPGQFKNWFYALIAMSTVLEDENPFKTVLGFGTMVDQHGHPFHKSAGNAIEFVEGADKFGADIIRWVNASANPSQNVLFGEMQANEAKRRFYLILWNVYKFFVEYSNLDRFEIKNNKEKIKNINVLDVWILSRLKWLIDFVDKKLREYNAYECTAEVEKFVTDLSTWYVRRSRDRVWVNTTDKNDTQTFYTTLYTVLTDLAVLLSPFMPFISEELYTNLTGEESVHLASWPAFEKVSDMSVITDMEVVRQIVEVGHRVRKENKLKVKQPLAAADVTVPTSLEFKTEEYKVQYESLIKAELNSKQLNIQYDNTVTAITVTFDTKLSDELVLEGELREVLRQIQQLRKDQGVQVDEKIKVTLPEKFKPYEEQIKQKVLASSVNFNTEVSISRV